MIIQKRCRLLLHIWTGEGVGCPNLLHSGRSMVSKNLVGVTRDIGRYVEGCNLCQRMKNRTEEVAGKLKLSEVPKKL